MIRTNLATLSYEHVAAAYNTVYTGYFMPFNVDSSWVEQAVERLGIVLAHSPLWLDDDGATVGMAAIGIRAERGWIGGFGIAPAYRGRKLSHDLARASVESARAAGIRRLYLEVLAQNMAAIRVYERARFSYVRDLLVLSRTNPVAVAPPDEHLRDAPARPDLITARSRMPAVRPAWQRDVTGLPPDDDMRALVVWPDDPPRGLGFYRLSERGVSLVDLAATDDSAARTLVHALIRLAPDRPLMVVNEPEDSPLLPALYAAGWTDVMRQHEMAIDL